MTDEQETAPLSVQYSIPEADTIDHDTIDSSQIEIVVVPVSNERLELQYSSPRDFVQRIAKALGYCSAGSPAVVGYVRWSYYRDGDKVGEPDPSKKGLVLSPGDGETIELDVGPIKQDPCELTGRGWTGPLDNDDADGGSVLPGGPVPVDRGSFLHQVRAIAEQCLQFYSAYGDDEDEAALVEGSATHVRSLARHHDREGTLDGFRLVGSHDEVATLLATDVHEVSIERDWLDWRAAQTDLVERFIREYVTNCDPDRADQLYYKLLAAGVDPYPELALPVVTEHPDPKAAAVLVLCLWNDNAHVAPKAVEALGSLLRAHDDISENADGYDRADVIDEIVGRIDSSDHPDVREAAIQTLDDLGLTDRDDVREAIEEALEDEDETVRAAAEAALGGNGG